MTILSVRLVCCVFLFGAPGTLVAGASKTKKSATDLRREYLARVTANIADAHGTRTTGSLWLPDAPLNEGSADYKAHSLNDLVTVIASVQTSASQSGTVDS